MFQYALSYAEWDAHREIKIVVPEIKGIAVEAEGMNVSQVDKTQ